MKQVLSLAKTKSCPWGEWRGELINGRYFFIAITNGIVAYGEAERELEAVITAKPINQLFLGSIKFDLICNFLSLKLPENYDDFE